MEQPAPPPVSAAGNTATLGRDLPVLILSRFGADDLAWSEVCRWWVQHLHPGGPACPACSTHVTDDARLSRFREFAEIRCPACGKRFTAKTGTILDGSKLDPREVYLLAFLLALKLPTRQIADIIKCDPNTVRAWAARFEAHSALQQGVPTP